MPPRAKELMDEPDIIDYQAPIKDVEEELDGAENTLIVKNNGDVVGEIHENSLLKALIPEEKLDEEFVSGVLGISFDTGYVPEIAEDVMNEHGVTVPEDETLGEIAFLMFREDIRSVPVENEEGEIVGIVHEDKVVEEGEVK